MGLRTACLSLTAVFLVVFVFISIISDDIQGIEGEDEPKIKPERAKEKAKSNVKKREAGLMDEFGNDEIQVGGKRFKLFEKKHLNYKKATAYCKKNDGKLAEAMNLEEMRRLQLLLMKARSIGNDMWVGADKKEWKKHSLKMQRRPNFGPDPMLFGGGPTEMCPALSVSTRSLTPVSCNRDLPFICEFGPGTGKTGNKATKADSGNKAKKVDPGNKATKADSRSKATKTDSKTKATKTDSRTKVTNVDARSKATKAASESKSKSKLKRKVEMRRKREILLNTFPVVNIEETTLAADDEDETTEMYITESPAEAAAEHNIGFSPHVEHVETEGVITSSKPGNISSKPTGATLKLIQGNTKATTTLDPDQMLIDLIDEQTLNLTAIELEAMNESTPTTSGVSQVSSPQLASSSASPSTDPKANLKMVEFMDTNDITDNTDTSSSDLEYGNNSALVLSDELQQKMFSDMENFSTDVYNATEFLPPTTNPTSKLPYTLDTEAPAPTTEVIEGNKRAIRNASHPHHVKVEESSTQGNNNTEESEGKAATTATVVSEDAGSQETSMNQNYTDFHPTTAASSLEPNQSSDGDTTVLFPVTSGTSTTGTSPSYVSSMMPALDSSNLSFSTYKENQTSYEDLQLTTGMDISNDTLANME